VRPETNKGSADPIQLAAKLSGHEATIKALQFTPGDAQLLSLAGDKTLRTWDVASHEAKVTELPLEGSIDDADFSLDGSLAAVSVPRIRQAHIWNVAESKEIVKFAPSELYAERIVFSPDGSKLLLSGKPAFCKVYDAKTGNELDKFIMNDEATTGAAFSADGRHVALSVPQEMSLWRTKDHHRTGNSWSTWPSSSCLAMGNELWAAGYIDGKVFMMWVNHDAPPETEVHPGLFEGVGRVTHLEFFDGDRFLLMTWDSGMIRIADLTTGKVVAEAQGPPGCAAEAALSSDRRYLATGGGEVWDEKLGRKSSAGDYQIYLWRLPENIKPKAIEQGMSLTEERVKELVSEAAGIPNDDWTKLASGTEAPSPNTLESQTLSLMLFSLRALPPAGIESELRAIANLKKDFQYLPEQTPKPAEIARALWISRTKGYASYIQPEYVTEVTVNVSGDTASGEVAFEKEELYRGRVRYVARWVKDDWRIEEFHLPNVGLSLQLSEAGVWKRLVQAQSGDDSP
jgi:hypothetical protein